LLAVRFFRPDYPVADWDDFTKQDRKLVCETPGSIWKSLFTPEKSKALLACINSLEKTANYLYIPKAQPFLEVDPLNKEIPLCLYTELPTLPLPREIYFLAQTVWKVPQETFAMSFDTKANQIADTELRTPRFEVKLKFPLSRPLETVQDLNIWLTTVVFTLFEEKGQIKASIVPDLLSQACFKDDSLFQDKKTGKIPAVFWP
jgi:hypothetical protein